MRTMPGGRLDGRAHVRTYRQVHDRFKRGASKARLRLAPTDIAAVCCRRGATYVAGVRRLRIRKERPLMHVIRWTVLNTHEASVCTS